MQALILRLTLTRCSMKYLQGVPKKRTNKTIKNGQTCQVCQLSKRVRIVNQDVFLPFGPLFGPCRPFWTISNKKLFFAKSTSAKPYFVLMGQQIDFCVKQRWANNSVFEYYSNNIRIPKYSYSYSVDIFKPNNIRIRIRVIFSNRIIFVFVFGWFFQTK